METNPLSAGAVTVGGVTRNDIIATSHDITVKVRRKGLSQSGSSGRGLAGGVDLGNLWMGRGKGG